jgi:hypothetical protein
MPADFWTGELESDGMHESRTDAGRPGLPLCVARGWEALESVAGDFWKGELESDGMHESRTDAGRPGHWTDGLQSLSAEDFRPYRVPGPFSTITR